MKFLIKIFAAFAAMVLIVVTVIKFVQGCSYKEAVGIAEELFKEIKDSCCKCCMGNYNVYSEEKSSEKT